MGVRAVTVVVSDDRQRDTHRSRCAGALPPRCETEGQDLTAGRPDPVGRIAQ
jgi:hypothetical protein